MKSTLSILVSLPMLLVAAVQATACGPYFPEINREKYFSIKRAIDYDNNERINENIRLWQELTSTDIPEADVRRAVYKDAPEVLEELRDNENSDPKNLFHIYLKRTDDREVIDFLITAKRLERVRDTMNSPWYYPSSRHPEKEGELGAILKTCKAYRGSRLADRYALQGVRALFAATDWEGCISYFDSTLNAYPDSNLFKLMAQGYVAGCWTHLGQQAKADSLSTLCGAYTAIPDSNRIEFIARMDPNAPVLLALVSEISSDSAQFARLVPLMHSLARSPKVTHKGDWELALAYYYGDVVKDLRKARAHIRRACSGSLSDVEVRREARAYRAKLDARAGDRSHLAQDIRWMAENDCESYATNIIYEDWIPTLWKQGDHATALLLCAYADHVTADSRRTHSIKWTDEGATVYTPVDDLRASETDFNDIDYGSLGFQLMGSLTSAQLAVAYNRMRSPGQFDFLRRYMRPDADYYNELIGTLALREENYARAVAYLSKVSDSYLRTMNIYKFGYLGRDPFVNHRAPQDADRAKLNFARRMLELRRKMLSAHTPDERAMATLKYELGYYNSFNDCWALTQYSKGTCLNEFKPTLDFWNADRNEPDYGFLSHYVPGTRKAIDNEYRYRARIPAALAAMTTDEARAEAEYFLGNLRTVIRHFPETAAASRIKTSCDGWFWWF